MTTEEEMKGAVERLTKWVNGEAFSEDRSPYGRTALLQVTDDVRLLLSTTPTRSQGEGEAVAWSFEINKDGTYTNWSGTSLSLQKPSVPEGSIRNLTPLYAHPAEYHCPKCGAAADERFDCCEVREMTQPAEGGDGLLELLADDVIEACAEAHYGKRRARQSGGARGIAMTVNGADYSFRDMMRHIWPVLRAAIAKASRPSTEGGEQ